EKLGIVRLESKALLETVERARKIPQRKEDESEAGKAFGARQIGFQRFLKTGKRAVKPRAPIVGLPEAVQRIEAVRLMLQTFGVKPFGLGEFALTERAPSAPQQV